MVLQSEICNLSGLGPAELIRKGEEAEVRSHSFAHHDIPSDVYCSMRKKKLKLVTLNSVHVVCMYISQSDSLKA